MAGCRFGPAGNCDGFYAAGYRRTEQEPLYLKPLALDAFEYSFGRGVTLGEEAAVRIRKAMEEGGIALSVHAPYFINLCVEDAGRVEKNLGYFLKTARAALWMGASRAVFHPGAVTKMSRERAMELAAPLLKKILFELDAAGFGALTFCPETMGKINQFGDLTEVIALCRLDERLIPAVDFAHLHARGRGALNTPEDFAAVLDALENGVGQERARKMHVHFSRIEFTAMGEKRHHTFAEREYGPEFAPLSRLLAERGYEARIICESAGTQAEDAAAMKEQYLQACAALPAMNGCAQEPKVL